MDIFTYSVYLDDPSLAYDVIDVIESEKLQFYSAKIGNVHYIKRCVEVFDNFLVITMALILVACAFFLISFGIKSIRSNIYEIGVIKAMGGIRSDISKIFISQSLVIGLGILVLTFFGMQITSYVANEVFMAALEAVLGSTAYGIKAIDFYPSVALLDICIALIVVFISAITSTKSIDRLNLISILKAKE